MFSIHSEHLQAGMDLIEGKMNEIVETARVTLIVTRRTLPQLSLEFCEAMRVLSCSHPTELDVFLQVCQQGLRLLGTGTSCDYTPGFMSRCHALTDSQLDHPN